MDQPPDVTSPAMHVLGHHLYEYDKGVRQMVLMTTSARDVDLVTRRLTERCVDYYVQAVSASKFNVFFGRPAWIETVRNVVRKPLNQLSAEEDFMLGILLGYDKEKQCLRFLSMTKAGRRAGAAAEPVS
ncbi:DUF2023 family protein [Azospirillum sp. TSO22-1]|uniref:DUF2023 family protein n=1 Tax=Azospirillum sp. TSO22-1 TaxID=716789 RepID=UPI000D60EFE5|nr:DUF2023 family protein [Azospirillum sp. TSO22-1]PWC56193.1 hypothetical protein TSO221_02685 [Azospirillum sp. TSO22-1]